MFIKDEEWITNGQVLAAVNADSEDLKENRLNTKIIEYTDLIASQFHSVLNLISTHLTPMLAPGERNTGSVFKKLNQKILEHQHEKIQSLCQHTKIRLKNRHVSEGLAQDKITELSQDIGAQLVVMGSHRSRGIKAMLYGNTAERVLSQSKYEVLTVPA